MSDSFLAGVKRACTGDPDTPFVLLGNFEVEDEWAAGEVGLPRAGGWECETVDEFVAAAAAAAGSLRAGRRVGVKDAFGVSGKGIVVVADERRLDQLVRMVARRAERTGDGRLAVVVEEWADKAL